MVLSVNKNENRCLPRVDFATQMRYQVRGKPDFANVVSSDISCGGLRFSDDKFIPTATAVMLEINVLNRVLRPIGKVAWSTPQAHSNRNQMGVEFVEFDTLERNYLKEFINMQLS